jgi:hypothetical protein
VEDTGGALFPAMHANFDATHVFDCSPTEATIEADGTQEVTLRFRPDLELPGSYFATFKVEVPNQTKEHLIHATARCWERQLYVAAADSEGRALPVRPTPSEENEIDPFALPVGLGLDDDENDMLQLGEQEGASEGKGDEDGLSLGARENVSDVQRQSLRQDVAAMQRAPTTRTFELQFPTIEDDGEGSANSSKQYAVVGACADPVAGGSGGGGSYELIFEDGGSDAQAAAVRACFVADAMKGSVQSGKSTKITFTFTPPMLKNETAEDKAALRVGQWLEARVTCKLSGGFVPDGQQGTSESVVIVLRGFTVM